MSIVATIVATIAFMIIAQRVLVRIAMIDSDNDLIDNITGKVWRFCNAMGWSFPDYDPPIRPEMDRYPDDLDAFMNDTTVYQNFVTKIVVPSEEARIQVMHAVRYLHDQDIDTQYVAVNQLVHCYTDADGEPTGNTPWIVVEPPHK